jgi:DNA-binding transcriptional LysR family regulator
VLRDLQDIQRVLNNLSGQVSGQLSMGTSHHIGLHRLPPLLKNYTRQYPQVKLDISFLGSEEICLAVARGDLELGVCTLPLTPADELIAKTIWNDPLCFVVSSGHSLATRGRVPPEELLRHPAVLTTRPTFTRILLQEALSESAGEISCDLSTDYLETLKMMVSIGLGWSLLPATLVTEDLARLEVEGIELQRTLGVITHRQRTLSNAARAMLDELTAAADSQLGD